MSGGGSIVSGSGATSATTSIGDKTAFGELSVAEITSQVLIHFPYNLNTDIVNTLIVASGAVTHSDNFAVIASGASTSSSGMLLSNKTLEYNPGIGGLCRFTAIFGAGTAGNTQISGIGNVTDGFFFGYNGVSFGILHRNESVDTWVAQTAWNTDPMDGAGTSGMTLDTSKGNVFQIRYQWLGFGAIKFYIENQSTGELVQVHQIDYSNQNTDVSVHNPTFPFCASSENTSNNTDIQMKIPSIGLFIEGSKSTVGHTRNAVDKSLAVTTEVAILTIRNKTTYQSIANRVNVQPDFITLAADGAKNVIFRAYLNATLGGSPSFSDVRTNNSVVDWDSAATTVSGGVKVATMVIAKNKSEQFMFNDFDFILSPGATFTMTAESAASNDVDVGVSWAERFT